MVHLTKEQEKRRRTRNIALVVVLFALVLLFYGITMVRISGAA